MEISTILAGTLWIVVIFFVARFGSILVRIPGRVKELEKRVRELEREKENR